MKLRAITLACAAAILTTTSVSADLVDDADFTETTWLADMPGMDDITGMAWAPDGSNRLFLTRKGGEVRIVQMQANGSAALLPDAFATIAPVHTNNECGLVGIAFDPDFVNNDYVYFFVTVSSSEQQIIRYTANGNTGEAKTPIVTDLPTLGENHDGGGIGFGPDGLLYWAIGDLGDGVGVDGDLESLAAKVGRATREGAVPAGNPFADGAGGNDDYIFARGFRNPFTLTFQPTTGLLWVNVVGTSYEQVFVVRSGDHAGYNDFENNQPDGYITPIIAYQTGDARNIGIAGGNGAVRSGGVVTFTTTSGHRLRQGERVVVAGVADASFNGTFYVATGSDAPNDTTFTVVAPGPDAASGGGSITTMEQGRTLSGGTFYDATAFPAEYHDDFFYGDFNTGRQMRAAIATGTTIASVDYWSTDLDAPIDCAIGPDGALYTASYNGRVYRTAYDATAQAIIVSNRHVRAMEGGAVVLSVSLAEMPAGDVTVTVARSAGDDDVTVAAGASLTFTPANWMYPQAVRIAAATDADAVDDAATITVASTGLASQTVAASVLDSESEPGLPDGGVPDGGTPPPGDDDGGCGCRLASTEDGGRGALIAAIALVAILRRRRR